MSEPNSIIHVDPTGVILVGKGNVRLDDIVAAHSRKHPPEAILARFPSITREELNAALDYHLHNASEGVPRGPGQRDADWRRWNATLAEDFATDTPPNAPTNGSNSA